MAGKIRSNKIFIGVKDETFEDRKQVSVISSLVADDEVYLNQYGKIFTEDEIGNFDIKIVNNIAVLEFFPIDGNINNYSYNYISYSIKKYIEDINQYDFGNCLTISSEHNNIGIGSTKSILTFNENISSLKILVETSSETTSNYEYTELNLIIKDSEAYITEFGKITLSDDLQLKNSGFGTFGVSFSNQTPELIFYSNIQEELKYNLICISIFNENFTGTNANQIRFADIKSNNINISSSNIPTQQVITSYDSQYNFGYFVVQITDKTNNEIQLSEIILLNNDIECSMIQYGDVYTLNTLGTFDCTSYPVTELLFTPNPDIDVGITLLHHTVSTIPLLSVPSSLDFNNFVINAGFSKYNDSSSANLKKSFELTHKNIPIFKRRFDGSSTQSGIDLDKNLIYIPNHFFKSGEKIQYSSNIFDYIDILTSTTTQESQVGSDIIYLDSTLNLVIGDFLNLLNGQKNELIEVTSSYVRLSDQLQYDILTNSLLTFSRLSEIPQQSSQFISAIQISDTYITGIGITNRLGGELYIYKLNDSFVGLCTSPIDALVSPPNLIDLTGPGLGKNHYITAVNQNSKCLITIDNVIQAPVSATNIKTTLVNNLTLEDEIVYCSGISSFFSGDIIKINDEIMKINYSLVGVANSFIVERPFLGTGISSHSSGSEIVKLSGNYNIVDNTINFASAPYGPIYDDVNGDVNIRSTFQGRVFTRSGIPNSNIETYKDNYIFDDISEKFNGVKKDFNVTTNGDDISGISTYNSILLVNNILQSPEVDYNLSEELSKTEINFTGTATSALYDVNNASVPRGGVIISVGSSNGYGYQPLVSAGGTAIVSLAGTIQSISIGNSGSGYRPGVQSIVNVGVQTFSDETPKIEYIGTATVLNGNVVSVAITNPGSGYSNLNPPKVIFDAPLSYSNLELKYFNSNSGIGSQAKIDIVVGQGSSIIDFNIKNYGYSYKVGDTLTLDFGGISGIPTDASKQFEPFLLRVERVFTDTFSGWTMGEFQKLDDIDHLFDGNRKRFPIVDNNNRFAITSREGSSIDLKAVLLIFINDVIQEPDVAYKFDGGSIIEFTEAPKKDSKCRIVFYRGTPNVDVRNRDIIETVKVGDQLRIFGNNLDLIENYRLVSDIILPDVVETLPYNSVGISSDDTLFRPVEWCKQKEDTFVGGINVSKSRINYDSNIFPVSNIIQPISIGQTQIYVDNVKSLFDPINENTNQEVISFIEILENANLITAIGTAIISELGSVESIDILNNGSGYSFTPEVSLQYPVESKLGIATLTAEITSGSVSNINVEYAGYGYTSTNPPLVLIEPPKLDVQTIKNVSYIGDNGIITGINTISVGYANTGLVFDLYIPQDSYLRNSLVTNPEILSSQIEEGYYLKISNTNIGFGVTSLRSDGSIIGIGTTGIDNIYQVISVSTGSTDVYGVGVDTVVKVIVSISDYNGISGTGYSAYYGDYSWGLININSSLKNYNVSTNYGVVGLNSTPIVRRLNRLRSKNYTDT